MSWTVTHAIVSAHAHGLLLLSKAKQADRNMVGTVECVPPANHEPAVVLFTCVQQPSAAQGHCRPQLPAAGAEPPPLLHDQVSYALPAEHCKKQQLAAQQCWSGHYHTAASGLPTPALVNLSVSLLAGLLLHPLRGGPAHLHCCARLLCSRLPPALRGCTAAAPATAACSSPHVWPHPMRAVAAAACVSGLAAVTGAHSGACWQ